MFYICSFVLFWICLNYAVETDKYRYFVTTNGLNPQIDSLYLGPQQNNASTRGKLRGSIPYNNSNWHIAEWNIPNILPLKAIFPNETSKEDVPCNYDNNDSDLRWFTNSTNGIVCLYQNKATNITEIELHLNGKGLECGTEYDLFAAPITPQLSGYPVAFIGKGPGLPFLSNLINLTLEFEILMIKNYTIIEHCGTPCGKSGEIDYGYFTVGIPISNELKKQTIMYQIGVFDSRDDIANCNADMCKYQEHWYGSNGYMNSIASFGYDCIDFGTSNVLKFKHDLLPFYKHIFKNASENSPIENLDTNLSNWQVGSLYIGGGIQGMADIDLLVTNIDLVGYL